MSLDDKIRATAKDPEGKQLQAMVMGAEPSRARRWVRDLR